MNDLDWATVRLLRATSSREALDHYYRAEWQGLPAYDALPSWTRGLQPRDRIARCVGCGAPYQELGQAQLYCSEACRGREGKRRWNQRMREANKERYNAARRARRRGKAA